MALRPGGRRARGRQLRDRHVRRAPQADVAVAPRLVARPLDDLGPVALLVGPERVPRALRRAGAAHVDDDVDVAALDQVRVGGPERALLVVWRLGDDHRVAPGLVGAVDVRAEDDAVRHRDRDVLLGRDAVGRRPVVGSPVVGQGRRRRDQRQQDGRERPSASVAWSALRFGTRLCTETAPAGRSCGPSRRLTRASPASGCSPGSGIGGWGSVRARS